MACTKCFLGLLALIYLSSVFCQEEEMKIEILHKVEECARKTKKNDLVTMHYTGTLENGTQFDSR